MNEAGNAQPNVQLSDEELIRACEEFTAQQEQLAQDEPGLLDELDEWNLWVTPEMVRRILEANQEE